jgi:hypothetical protein
LTSPLYTEYWDAVYLGRDVTGHGFAYREYMWVFYQDQTVWNQFPRAKINELALKLPYLCVLSLAEVE